MIDWRRVCFALLNHFDQVEGTTYLYQDYQRDYFVSLFPETWRAEIAAVLKEYHEKASGIKS